MLPQFKICLYLLNGITHTLFIVILFRNKLYDNDKLEAKSVLNGLLAVPFVKLFKADVTAND